MKKFILIRHAKSSWSDSELKDIDRPLNKRGLRDAPIMAEKLFESLKSVDHIVSSPANRAITTALEFAKAFQFKSEEIEIREDLYHAYPEELMNVIHTLDESHQLVLIFGHNPTFTTISDSFSKDYLDNLPTCGIAIMESTAEKWENIEESNTQMVELLYPKML